jgi:hypothetical protein
VSAFTIEETVHIAAPPEAVWRLLVDTHSWRLWWPACIEAETKDRKNLHDGSEFLLRLKLGWLQTKLWPRVDAATPPKLLVWTGRGFGLTGRHAFYLDAKPNGTFVRQQEGFDGPGLVLFRILLLDRATRKMFQANLRGLKRLAERAM